jgi:hypothetical protein
VLQPLGRVRLVDHLDEDIRQLRVELAARWEADAELEALRPSAARLQDFMLDNVDGSFSLVVSLSTVVELLMGQIDSTVTKGVRLGTQSMLITALSHFPKLKSELELLRSRRNVDLTEDPADAV